MGYCGTQPCGQTKGPRFFYSEEKTPTDILMSGEVCHWFAIGDLDGGDGFDDVATDMDSSDNFFAKMFKICYVHHFFSIFCLMVCF